MLIKIIEIIGALLLLLSPFVSLFSLPRARWTWIALPFTGILIGLYVALSFYLESIGTVQDSRYWPTFAIRGILGGFAGGILFSYGLHEICGRFINSKPPNTALQPTTGA